MKTIKYLSMLAAAFLFTVSFSSCGDDNDEPTAPGVGWEDPNAPNKGNLSIGGYTADLKYCNMMAMLQEGDEPIEDVLGNSWPMEDGNGHRLAWCEIRFSSWDMTQNWETPTNQPVSYFQLSFYGYADDKGEFVSGNYTASGGSGCINENQTTWESDLNFNFEPATIKVVRGANNIYTVTLNMKGDYYLKGDWENTKPYATTFKYVGKMDNMRGQDM